ncbi:MAG: hypothetical protein IPN17_05700 [Deltaproteobacteria bacterium]|nr:hypothetical protein [Deltaproteobacteria bacterium]
MATPAAPVAAIDVDPVVRRRHDDVSAATPAQIHRLHGRLLLHHVDGLRGLLHDHHLRPRLHDHHRGRRGVPMRMPARTWTCAPASEGNAMEATSEAMERSDRTFMEDLTARSKTRPLTRR